MVYRIVVGGYTNAVSILIFDPLAKPPTLVLEGRVETDSGPSWVERVPNERGLVGVTIESGAGKFLLIKLSEGGGGGEVVESVETGGESACHVGWGKGEVIVANYMGGNVSVIPFNPSSSPNLSTPTQLIEFEFEGTGPVLDRQESSHPHGVYFYRDEVLVPDLGSDKVWRLNKSTSEGKWSVSGYVQFEKGTGPRHLFVHEDIMYTVGELSTTLHAHHLPQLPSPPTFINALSTLPPSTPPPPSDSDAPPLLPAEILFSPSSSTQQTPLIYISNRNEKHPQGDSIAIFTPLSKSHQTDFENVGFVRTGLDHVRGMVFSPRLEGDDSEGKYLVCGGLNGGGVKVFERSADGRNFVEVVSLSGKGGGAENVTSFTWI